MYRLGYEIAIVTINFISHPLHVSVIRPSSSAQIPLIFASNDWGKNIKLYTGFMRLVISVLDMRDALSFGVIGPIQ
jgi:hypothetical protein